MTEHRNTLRRIKEKIRTHTPLIHCLAPYVTANDMANMLLSIGASPIMACAAEEMEDIVAHADALCISTGNLDNCKMKAIERALECADKRGLPVVLDPVGIGVSSYRRAFVKELLSWAPVTVLKGNMSEMKVLFDGKAHAKGVDSPKTGFDLAHGHEAVDFLSSKYHLCVAMTGPVDIIGDRKRKIENHTGHPVLTRMTGSGCLLSALIAAFVTADKDPWEMTAHAVRFFGRAAEKAVRDIGTGGGIYDFRNAFIRRLSTDRRLKK